jgi:hypothetical protein
VAEEEEEEERLHARAAARMRSCLPSNSVYSFIAATAPFTALNSVVNGNRRLHAAAGGVLVQKYLLTSRKLHILTLFGSRGRLLASLVPKYKY